MIPDLNLEADPQWKVAPWNPGVGPVKPNDATVTPASPSSPYMEIYIDGPAGYSNALYATHRPLMPVFDQSRIYCNFSFELTPDADFPKLQCFEFEAMHYFLDAKGKCRVARNQAQLSYVNPANELQMWTPSQVWANTGVVVPPFTQPTQVTVNNVIDAVGLTVSTPTVVIGGKVYNLPPQFQLIPIPVQDPPWTTGVYVQFQLGCPKAGLKTKVKFRNVSVNWT